MDFVQFNNAQKEAILHKDGPALVLAGPGSGKTTVLTNRLWVMTKEYQIPQNNILVVTFTKAAAAQMKQRYEKLTGCSSSILFGTFHSIFYQILRESSHGKSLNLISEKEKYEYIRRCMYKRNLPEEYYPLIRDEIGRLKNLNCIPDNYQSPFDDIDAKQLVSIFDEYKVICSRNNKLDFDDMAYDCYHLFMSHPQTLKKWQQKFRYICIDEYQDINELQGDIMNMLALPQQNIFMVGDDDQSIYGFRGAASGIMLSLQEKYEHLRLLRLETNYRCHPEIIWSAAKVIAENKERYVKKQIPGRVIEERGIDEKSLDGDAEKTGNKHELPKTSNAVIISAYDTVEDEWRAMNELIKEWERKGELRESAILLRKNVDANRLINSLKKEKINYIREGHALSTIEDGIAEDLLAYIRLIHGDRKRKTLLRIMNRPDRGLDRGICEREEYTFAELKKFCIKEGDLYGAKEIEKLEKDCKMAASMNPFALLMYIRKGMGYERYLQQIYRKDKAEYEDAMRFLKNIQDSAADLHAHQELEIVLQEDRQKLNLPESAIHDQWKEKDMGGIHILTYHGSKGLEYKNVVLPDLNEGIVPHKKAEKEAEIEEERRLFYVGMTRAIDQLHLLYVKGTKDAPKSPSRFLKPLL